MISSLIKQIETTRDRLLDVHEKLVKYNHVLNLPTFAIDGFKDKANDLDAILSLDLNKIYASSEGAGIISNARGFVQGISDQLSTTEKLLKEKVKVTYMTESEYDKFQKRKQ